MAGKRAAVYLRISDDKRGDEAGVERQREDCEAFVVSHGWTLVEVYCDNDTSAFSGKVRKDYVRLCEAIDRGEVDVVVSWHPDRITRNARELEDLIDRLESTRTKVHTVRAGEYDLSTPTGRQTARIVGAIARGESEHKSDRVRRAMLQRAERGAWHGARRVYGYDHDERTTGRMVVVKPEARIIREAAKRILSGEPLTALVRDLNARGVPTLRGRKWSRTVLRSILISARVAGWREHTPGRRNTRSRIDGARMSEYAGGEFVSRGDWPAILDREQVERLRRILGDPSRRPATKPRSYLLSGGLVICGKCGLPMSGRPDHKRNGVRTYACAPRDNGNGCVRTIAAEPVEHYVLDTVAAAIDEGGLLQRLRRDAGEDVDTAWRTVAALEADLAALAADMGAGAISRGEWQAAREPLQARLAAAQAALSTAHGREAVEMLTGGLEQFLSRWDRAPLSGKRAMLAVALDAVVVGPGKPGRGSDPTARLSLVWRGHDERARPAPSAPPTVRRSRATR